MQTITSPHLKGIWAPVLSPMTSELSLDRTRFLFHLNWLFDQGIDGAVIFGTNGEATSFSITERKELLAWVRDEGYTNDQIIVGTGCSALADTVDLCCHATSQGYYNHLILPPFYYKKPTQQGLIDYYSEIIQRTNDPRVQIYLYNFPQLSGIHLNADLVVALHDKYPEVIRGYKDSSGDWNNTKEILAKCPSIIMFPGSEIYLTKVLGIGGAGVISGTANVNPSKIKQTYTLFKTDPVKAAELQNDIDNFRTSVERYPLIAALKALIQHYRQDDGWQHLRPPLTALAPENWDTLFSAVEDLNFTLKD
tara:strand:- start:27 stop:950 length:924 start_codon:yes stop_codon:yes gene_type:complete